MHQRVWALLLLAFVVAGVSAKELKEGASEDTSKKNILQRKEFIKSIEKSLLTMLGLKSKPKPKTKVVVSDYMWDLYYRHNKLHKGHFSKSSTVRCFRSQEKGQNHGSDTHQARYKFNVNSIPEHDEVWAAELVVYRQSLAGTSAKLPVHRLQVYDVLRPATKKEDALLRLVDTRIIKAHRHAGWESFDVLPALLRWLNTPSSNHGLHVEVTMSSLNATSPQHVRLKRSAGESHEQWLQWQPLLVTYSRDSRLPSRSRRSTRKHRRKDKKDEKDKCRRHALYVDFNDVGWHDWIVAPPGYDAYYCHGDCPFPLADHLNTTNHAIVQTLVNSVNPTAVPRACCVPTELSPISMLYVDEYDKVVLKNYQDMVVEGCGCR